MTALAPSRDRREEPARVLIVDDSPVVRTILSRMVAGFDRFAVTAAVADTIAARAVLAVGGVDLLLLDIAMPGEDGLSALPELAAAARGAPVLVLSSSGHDPAVVARAHALGAAGVLAKPGSGGVGQGFGVQLEARMIELLTVAAPAYDVVAIAASTGGVPALTELLRAVPPDCTTPILITQHLPGSFLPYFAEQIAVLGRRPCVVAEDHMRLQPGRLVVAPGDAHLRCVRLPDGHALKLSTEPAPSGCRPSADPMFASVAESFGARALAVVLSGMGRDGCEGARRIAAAGGGVVVQDQASAVVWGMPGAVAKAGLADAELTPARIGALIAGGGAAR